MEKPLHSNDLPGDTVYGETCASIGLVFFAQRMLQISPMGEYADVMEKALYNGIISGMSIDGTKFFYVNPLEVVPEACEKDHLRSHVKPERQKWFGCACCPPNLARIITSLSGYIFTRRESVLFVHLYIGSETVTLLDGVEAQVSMKTNYPWDEDVTIEVTPSRPVHAALAFRIPGWCTKYSIRKNGQLIIPDETNQKDGYVYVSGLWVPGDKVNLHFEMPVCIMSSSPLVRENVGKAAVMRGPVVYCLEEEDNGKYLKWIRLPKEPQFDIRFEKDLLGGVVTLHSSGRILDTSDWDSNNLYAPYKEEKYMEKQLKWIPYYVWANRSCGEMAVWINTFS